MAEEYNGSQGDLNESLQVAEVSLQFLLKYITRDNLSSCYYYYNCKIMAHGLMKSQNNITGKKPIGSPDRSYHCLRISTIICGCFPIKKKGKREVFKRAAIILLLCMFVTENISLFMTHTQNESLVGLIFKKAINCWSHA